MTELELIALIRRLAHTPNRRLPVPAGDDCAVWLPRAGYELLVTTDQLVEDVHYRKEWLTADQTGARALGRALSDIAAMGGEARLAFLSLALPADRDERWCIGFLRGFGTAACRHKVHWAGGDLSATAGPPTAAMTILGEAPRGTAILRSGARPGDRLFVSGVLGRRAMTITPRLALGDLLRRRRLATAMIDLSDGLSTDLGHLTKASGVGAVVQVERIPAAGPLQEALHRGEDYELLFTASRKAVVPARLAGVPLHEIGRMTRRREIILEYPDGRRKRLEPRGWEHFRQRAPADVPQPPEAARERAGERRPARPGSGFRRG